MAENPTKTVMGYTFKSDCDLSEQLGMNSNYVCSLKGRGFTYEEIITKAETSRKEVKSVLGYTFKSDAELSRQLGKYEGYVSKYKCEGLDYEEIILKAIGKKIGKDTYEIIG